MRDDDADDTTHDTHDTRAVRSDLAGPSGGPTRGRARPRGRRGPGQRHRDRTGVLHARGAGLRGGVPRLAQQAVHRRDGQRPHRPRRHRGRCRGHRAHGAGGGAPPDSPGTLVTLPLAECTAAGQTLDVELSFSVELGEGTDERIGYSAREEVAWLGTAYPLLAWDGAGWALDDAVPVPGETTTSTAFELASLVVRAPSRFEVTGVGAPAPAVQRADGTTEHRFSAPVVRDVTVTVGELDLVRESADGLTVVVAVPAGGSRAPATEWAQEVLDAAADLSDHFGPVPYDELWVSVLPGVTDGVEYSGAIQFGDVDPRGERWLLVHEVAHQWFYGLVGNNQARDPWMDEAFANYAEHLVSGDDDPTEDAVGVPGAVGRPMEFFADRRQPGRTYVDTVYLDGGRALVQARRAVDPDAFDEAVRRYLAENAHAVASPDDLVDALAGLPVAVQVLRDRGALPPEGR
ncbi:M1 family aminopeptidase [Ornithinimicrobium sp. W1665]|uniref:M1 family aminopeptidase n=1 Tax=Ornithinimicrobium sp. W1665 TaxID=3416666 RepID=UPI003D6BC39E